jgi:site-specific DNA recombinase
VFKDVGMRLNVPQKRNITYQMIGILRNIAVQAMAIDQPIDFSIPESTVMLAVYLSIPEAENGRRALNTSGGMRRARKEGRWMGAAPKGYVNLVSPDGRKYIAPKQPEADLMKWCFEELAKGILSADQVRKRAYAQGLNCGRNNFWKLIRNPMYCGIIVVPPYENEEMQFVKAQHEALISEGLFYDVQDVLNGKKRKVAKKIVSLDMLPLRGFLECPDCNRMLTGSVSKGKYYRYYYYHCSGTICKCRFKAEVVNEAFEKELIKYNLAPGAAELFKMVVMDEYQSSNREDLDERKHLARQIEEQEQILSSARKKFLKDMIDEDDFKATKIECNDNLKVLESRLSDLPARSGELKTIENLLNVLLERHNNILQYYRNQDVTTKRHLISSMYPENLCFDGTQHRTLYVSEPLSLILLVNRELDGIKKGESSCFKKLSPRVAFRRIQPRLEIIDIMRMERTAA